MEQTIIEALQSVMEQNHEITNESIHNISKSLGVPESEVYGVATFYTQFKLKKKAKYNIELCMGTACFILGGESILEILKKRLNLINSSSQDGLFHLSIVRCLGCCSEAPVMSINGTLYGKLDKNKIEKIISNLESDHDWKAKKN